MTNLTTADHDATFTVHPLEGSSRLGLLGLLAELGGLTKEDAPQTERTYSSPPSKTPDLAQDERELANTILGERVVDAMFGTTGPVRVTMSGKPMSTVTNDCVSLEHPKPGTQ